MYGIYLYRSLVMIVLLYMYFILVSVRFLMIIKIINGNETS